MCLVIYLSLFTEGFHTRLVFTAALQMVKLGLRKLETFELLKAGLEVTNLNSELSFPFVPYSMCVWVCYAGMCRCVHIHVYRFK